MEENKDIFDHIKVKKIQTPDASYFENMANQIIAEQNATAVTKVIPLYKRPITWVGSIAAILIIGLLFFPFSNGQQNNNQTDNPLLALNEIPSDEIFTYVNDHIEEFDTDLISEAIPTSTLDNEELIPTTTVVKEIEEEIITPQEPTTPIELEEIDANEILDYFNEEGIDLDELELEEEFI